MPATTPPKGRPTPKREAQRKLRSRGLPGEEVVAEQPEEIVGYGSITLPSISTSTDKE